MRASGLLAQEGVLGVSSLYSLLAPTQASLTTAHGLTFHPFRSWGLPSVN